MASGIAAGSALLGLAGCADPQPAASSKGHDGAKASDRPVEPDSPASTSSQATDAPEPAARPRRGGGNPQPARRADERGDAGRRRRHRELNFRKRATMSGTEPKIQGGSQLATKYDVSGNVSAGRWIYSPYHNHLLPITGYHPGS